MNRATRDQIAALRALHAPSGADLIRQLPEARVGVDFALSDLAHAPSTTGIETARRQLQGALALVDRIAIAYRRAGE